MNRILAEAIGLILALAIGFAVGWHAKGVSVAAGEAKASNAAVIQITDSVNKQAAKQQADMQAEQGKSVELAAQQQTVRAASVDIRLEIDNASFTPGPIGVAASCPEPDGTDEFVRLYQRAAEGVPASAASATAPR